MMNPDRMDTSILSDPMSLSIPDSFRRGGSLPFKKRKLYCAFPEENSSSEHMSIPSSLVSCIGGDDEKIAALALVAAATAALPTAASFPGLFASPTSDEKSSQLRMHFIRKESDGGSFDLGSSELSDSQPVFPVAGDPHNKLKNRQRIHHPPLTAPLPGGCHGRTSRNNSYCRRQPCYNGSKYCKLHYQQYIVAGIRAPADSTSSETSSVVVESSSGRTTPLAPAHQDKRYTGLEGEVRCLATTTRGRSCAYVSVNDTRYCYLHSDYDTNPPPRRGGNNCPSFKARAGGNAGDSVSGDETATHSDDPLSSQDGGGSFKRPPMVCSVLMKTPDKSPPSITSDESCSASAWVTPRATSSCEATTSAFQDTASTEEAKEASDEKKSGYPLLSSISSDQWFDKRVLISTGPLMNRSGRVVKWGNGWVSVRVTTGVGQEEEGLLHNRRSIELSLLPDGSEEEKEEEKGTSSVPDGVHEMPEALSPLRRCVTYEVDAAAAADLLEVASFGAREFSSFKSSQATECTNESNSPASERSHDSALADKSMDNVDDERMSPSTRNDENGCQNEARAKPEFVDAAQSSTGSVKSCNSGSPHEKGLPLVEILAREGLSRQHLDLLFGTAALERGRRKVHKPARYEDKAMLEKRRGSPLENDFDNPSKRQRPVSSPRTAKKSP